MSSEHYVLVTGANRGIGKEIVRQLAEHGSHVFLGSRDLNKGQEVAKEIGSDLVFPLELDVTSEESIAKAVEEVKSHTDRLDALINNAGIGVGRKTLVNPDIDEIKDIMQVNFYGPMMMNKHYLPLLRKSETGRIINMSSGMGAKDDLVGGYAGYRLSKWGLNGQTILLANELDGTNIKVAAMCPGWVRTDMGGASAPRSLDRGADTAVWLATTDDWETGKFWRDRKVIPY